ncbi:DUF5313 family protein [Parasphingorhabdus pacifica]
MSGRRPNPVLWLRYQYGGTLPAKYREWVLHDVTCGSWVLRVAVRGLVQVAPAAVGMLLCLGYFGGSWPVALGSVLLGVLVIVRIALTNSVDSTNARLTRYGYPPGHASEVRNRMDEATAERYRAVWRQHS